jgi:hypothetical protein
METVTMLAFGLWTTFLMWALTTLLMRRPRAG